MMHHGGPIPNLPAYMFQINKDYVSQAPPNQQPSEVRQKYFMSGSAFHAPDAAPQAAHHGHQPFMGTPQRQPVTQDDIEMIARENYGAQRDQVEAAKPGSRSGSHNRSSSRAAGARHSKGANGSSTSERKTLGAGSQTRAAQSAQQQRNNFSTSNLMNMTMTQINQGRDRELHPLAKRKFAYQNFLTSKQSTAFLPSPPRQNMRDISPATGQLSISPHIQSRVEKSTEGFKNAQLDPEAIRNSASAYGAPAASTADKLTQSCTPTPFRPSAAAGGRDFQSPMRNTFNLATIADKMDASPRFASRSKLGENGDAEAAGHGLGAPKAAPSVEIHRAFEKNVSGRRASDQCSALSRNVSSQASAKGSDQWHSATKNDSR